MCQREEGKPTRKNRRKLGNSATARWKYHSCGHAAALTSSGNPSLTDHQTPKWQQHKPTVNQNTSWQLDIQDISSIPTFQAIFARYYYAAWYLFLTSFSCSSFQIHFYFGGWMVKGQVKSLFFGVAPLPSHVTNVFICSWLMSHRCELHEPL